MKVRADFPRTHCRARADQNANGFSAHAGQTELMQWLGHLTSGKPKGVLTHSEARGREPLGALIQRRHRIKVSLPVQGEVIEI